MSGKKVDLDTVKHVAKLSRIELGENEIRTFSEQLNVILEHINELNEVNTDNVEPTSHSISGVKNVFRDDKLKGSLPQQEVLKNAPKQFKDFFGVPKIIE